MNKNLKNQTAIISGALGDIGRAIALELAARGANVALGDVKEASGATAFLEELKALGVESCYHRVDVSDATQVEDWVEAVSTLWQAPSLIIPNAAIVTIKTFSEVTPAEWSRELRINLDGAVFLAQTAALRLLKENKPGRIVFTGSWAAERAHPHIPAYSAAKAGLRMAMQCMALEWASRDILVNEIAPGYVNAGLSGRIFDKDPEVRKNAIARVPIHRLIETKEVAAQVAHLCDPENRHMTGSTLTMDGGLSLQSNL